MELVVKLWVARKVALEELADIFVGMATELAIFRGIELVAVPFEDTAGVGVDDEYGMAGGVEKDRVGGFWADAVNCKKLSAKRLRFGARHLCGRALIFGAEETDEGF